MTRMVLGVGVLLSVLAAPVRADVVLGQVQTFGEPHGWVQGGGPGGAPVAPLPIAFGGPGGPGDPYLEIVATGEDGPGSRLSAQNFDEWAGNYLAAGITQIEMDVRNFGTTDLFLRLLFVQFGAMGPVALAFTTAPVFVPGGSDWQGIAFDVSPAALTPLFGSLVDLLSNAHELRLFHNPAGFFSPGENPAVVGTLGVDNITAATVPEPATWALLSGGLLLYGLTRRHGRRR